MMRGQGDISSDAKLIRGRAWHVYPDPATVGVMVGDHPFGTEEPPGPDRGPVRLPEGVIDSWLVGKNTPGIQNDHEGHSYLVLTEGLDPPPVAPGWFFEAARLREDFEIDQRGDRWVRLVRFIASAETRWGTVHDCEFQVDRT